MPSSPKVTSKNLSYESNLPPFLRALHAQSAGREGPDPILAARRRGAKKRSSSEEAEDQPLVVDEDGNVVAVDVDGNGVASAREEHSNSQAGEQDGGVAGSGSDLVDKKGQNSMASIGAGRKRKVGRVIGANDDWDGDTENSRDKTDGRQDSNQEKSKTGRVSDNPKPKPIAESDKPKKKKPKKIKLSFDPE